MEREQQRRFDRRWDRRQGAAFRVPRRRMVSFNNGNITIAPLKPNSLPFPKTSSLPHKPLSASDFPPLSTFLSNPQKNTSSPTIPPIPPSKAPSFADLLKPHLVSPSSKGILPLPEEGWTTVSRRRPKRPRSAQSTSSLPPSHKLLRCFLCGDRAHMAKDCTLGDFKCFACNLVGHTSLFCPNSSHPLPHSIVPTFKAKSSRSPSSPPPLFIPNIPLPESVVSSMDDFIFYAFFKIQVGNPTYAELIDNLEFHLKVDEWKTTVRRASSSSFFIQFPDAETMDYAYSKSFFSMGNFGGVFSPWSENIGLKALPKFVYVWVEILDLPIHLWDTAFISSLLGDVGEVITVSDDIMFKKEASKCKAMLYVRDASEIPRVVKFRYESPDNIHIMEGCVRQRVVGKVLPDSKSRCREFYESFIRKEGASSSPSEDLPPPPPLPPRNDEVVQPVQSNIPPHQDPKGKKPMRQSCDLPQAHPSLPKNTVISDLMEVSYKGVKFHIAKSSWEKLQLVLSPEEESVQEPAPAPPNQDKSLDISSSDSMDNISSSGPPPGFGKVKARSKNAQKKASKSSLSLLPLKRHLALQRISKHPGAEEDRMAKRIHKAAIKLKLDEIAKKRGEDDVGDNFQ